MLNYLPFFLAQTLEPSEEDHNLTETGDCEDVLKEVCPQIYDGVSERDLVVWVDPLDGTSEFTEGKYCQLIQGNFTSSFYCSYYMLLSMRTLINRSHTLHIAG